MTESTFNRAGQYPLYVVSHGWHTGLVIPASVIQEKLPQLKARFPDAPYLELGWGDRGFYQAREITSGLTLRAIFWPTASVVHVVALPEDVAAYFRNSEVLELCLSEEALASLTDFVTQSFTYDQAGQLIAEKTGIYGNSQFYQGAGDYFLMNTCNKWTAKALRSAGMDISPAFKLTAGSVMEDIREWQKQAEQENAANTDLQACGSFSG